MKIAIISLLVLLIGGVYGLVYVTGGIKFVYSHSMYIPIMLAGFVFGLKGGLVAGFLAGVVLGPFMPIDVASGEIQETVNWVFRTGLFSFIGFLSGAATDTMRAYQRHLKWLLRHEISTGLPNRYALLERLSTIAEEEPRQHPLFLGVISFENEMELKSAFGFTVIEEGTRQVAQRLERKDFEKLIYHTDTGQITILIDSEIPDVDQFLTELSNVSREPVLFDDIPIHIDMRMGYVTFHAVTEAPEVYLQRAEAALTVAYNKAQDSVAYNPSIKSDTEQNLSVLGELMDAIGNGDLVLNYQPKVAIATNEIVGVEALMRWHHPERGDIPPGVFIPRAEQSTLIQLISDFALNQAMDQIVKWRKVGIDMPVAVNISTRNLLQPGFTELILGLLDHYNLGGRALELEVTEGALMLDVERTIDELLRLSGAKLTISIDDFGTGYSSLQYLHQLPISLIKIDQSFVRRLPGDTGAAYILESAVMLAHKMGIKAVAEGVETEEVYDFLRNIGCDMVQGYLISRPLSANDFVAWYTKRSTVRGGATILDPAEG